MDFLSIVTELINEIMISINELLCTHTSIQMFTRTHCPKYCMDLRESDAPVLLWLLAELNE